MTRYVIDRLLVSIPVLIGITAVTFALVNILPGDPLNALLGENFAIKITPDQMAQFRLKFGLDQPLPVQYLMYLVRVVQGDLGRSYASDQPVLELVLSRLPATFLLGIASLTVALLVAVPLGVLSAKRRGSKVDGASVLLATIGVSMPTFWLGLVLILTFALGLHWLPTSGRGEGFLDGLRHLILPAITLGAGGAAILTRVIRSSMIEVLDRDYITTARAKGVPESLVLRRHSFKNAALPVVTLLGVEVGSLLSGAVVTETVFAWPGIGRLAIDAINRKDLPVVQGVVLLSAVIFLVVNFAVDISYAYLNPRIRLSTRS